MNIYSADVIEPYISLKGIKTIYINIRSICNKFDEFKLIVEELKPDIICITETWLNNTIIDNEIELINYCLYRKDREIRRGGGIAVYINKTRLISELIDYDTDLEVCVLKIKQFRVKSFNIAVIYRPPDSSHEFYENYSKLIGDFSNEELIIIGDFNIDLLNNENHNFIKLNRDKGLIQLLSEPTRCTETSSTLIDHIYSNIVNKISKSGVLDLSISDHKVIYLSRKINFKITENIKTQNKKLITYRSFKNFDIKKFNAELDSKIPYIYCGQNLDPNKFCNDLTNIKIETFDKYAPIKEKYMNENVRKAYLCFA